MSKRVRFMDSHDMHKLVDELFKVDPKPPIMRAPTPEEMEQLKYFKPIKVYPFKKTFPTRTYFKDKKGVKYHFFIKIETECPLV